MSSTERGRDGMRTTTPKLYAHGVEGLRLKTPNTARGVVVPHLSLPRPPPKSPGRLTTGGYNPTPGLSSRRNSRGWTSGGRPDSSAAGSPPQRRGGGEGVGRERRPWDIPDILVIERSGGESDSEGDVDGDMDEQGRQDDNGEWRAAHGQEEEKFGHSTVRFGATSVREVVALDIQKTLLRSRGIRRRVVKPVTSRAMIDFLATPRRTVGDLGRTWGMESSPLAWAGHRTAVLRTAGEEREYQRRVQESKESKKQAAIAQFRVERQARVVAEIEQEIEAAEVDVVYSRQLSRRLAEKGKEQVEEYGARRKRQQEEARRRREKANGAFGISAVLPPGYRRPGGGGV